MFEKQQLKTASEKQTSGNGYLENGSLNFPSPRGAYPSLARRRIRRRGRDPWELELFQSPAIVCLCGGRGMVGLAYRSSLRSKSSIACSILARTVTLRRLARTV